MPKLKQPVSLEEFAFEFVVNRVVLRCADLSTADLLDELRAAVTVIKHHVHDYLPPSFFAEFCRRFLEDFYKIGEERQNDRPDSHQRAALEMVMDVEIVGLTLHGSIVHYLNPVDAHRIRRLKTLGWNEYSIPIPPGLDNFHLQDLMAFIRPCHCTDRDLEIIGSRCPKLEVLEIPYSSNVTDVGLRALSRCSNLRVLHILNCAVTYHGVNAMLKAHTKIEQLHRGDPDPGRQRPFDILSDGNSSVYPHLKRLYIEHYVLADTHFHDTLKCVPNLTHLQLEGSFMGDLCILKDLNNLTNLKLSGDLCGRYTKHAFMKNLKQLLTSIGERISVLALRIEFIYLTQNELDFIFEFCSNIDFLSFDLDPRLLIESVVIPPFEKLRTLKISILDDFGDFYTQSVVDFDVMLALEHFLITDVQHICDVIESMILDDETFPNLKKVTTDLDEFEEADRLNQIAKEKNLDFSLEVLHCLPT